jgi:acyl carrier protein
MDRPWHAIVCSALARHLGVPAERIHAAQRLREDWGLRPLGLVNVALALEDAEGVELPLAGLCEARTVGDLAALLAGALGRPHDRRATGAREATRRVRRGDGGHAGAEPAGFLREVGSVGARPDGHAPRPRVRPARRVCADLAPAKRDGSNRVPLARNLARPSGQRRSGRLHRGPRARGLAPGGD